MSFSCSDAVDQLDALLDDKGYVIYNGNAETGETVDDESGDDWWFTWAAPGMAECEVGATCASSLEALCDAASHFFENADIQMYDTVVVPREALDAVLEYAQRYKDLNDEGPDGDCARACARACARIEEFL